MKENSDYEKDLSSIRTMMERSVKFLSLSGLSGILAGTYALLGSMVVYFILYYPHSPFDFQFFYVNEESVVFKFF
jgi:predicted lysophospholipase L1 biosynthesis ABC-type transport system permease subunit